MGNANTQSSLPLLHIMTFAIDIICTQNACNMPPVSALAPSDHLQSIKAMANICCIYFLPVHSVQHTANTRAGYISKRCDFCSGTSVLVRNPKVLYCVCSVCWRNNLAICLLPI